MPVAVRKHLLQHVFFRWKVQNVTLWKSPLLVLVTVLNSRVNPCRFKTKVLQCFLNYVNIIIAAHDMLGFCRVTVCFGLSLQNGANFIESFGRKCRKANQVVDCVSCAVVRKPSLLFKVNLLAWNTHLSIKNSIYQNDVLFNKYKIFNSKQSIPNNWFQTNTLIRCF
jgi:hypothetical protein